MFPAIVFTSWAASVGNYLKCYPDTVRLSTVRWVLQNVVEDPFFMGFWIVIIFLLQSFHVFEQSFPCSLFITFVSHIMFLLKFFLSWYTWLYWCHHSQHNLKFTLFYGFTRVQTTIFWDGYFWGSHRPYRSTFLLDPTQLGRNIGVGKTIK